MPNIKYSYVFDEELDRIYECFRDYQLNSGIVYNGLVTNLHFIKGEKFDEENAEFSFSWKNYYEIKMIVSNVKNTPNYRSYMNKIYYIDKLSLIISLIYRFYWDSVDEKTVFILDIDYQDIFFKDLIQTDYNKLDFLKICKNVEKYLNSIIQGLAINNSFLINAPINELWKAISNPEIFFTISGKKLVPVFKEKEVNLNSILEFYDSNDKKLNPTILTQMNINLLYVTSTYIKLTFITIKRLYIANHSITFVIKKIDNNKSMFIATIKLLEPSSHKIFLTVKRFWKKIMTNFYNHFESKNKKIKK